MIKSFGNEVTDVYSQGTVVRKIYSHDVLVYEKTQPIEDTTQTKASFVFGTTNKVVLPITLTQGMALAVDWGDGSASDLNFENHASKRTHTYASSGDWTVVLNGKISRFNFSAVSANMAHLKQIFPESKFGSTINDFSFSFSYCTNLASIPDGLFDNCTDVTSFGDCFYGCSGLTSIPFNLFDGCLKVVDFTFAFNGCSAITSKLPELWLRTNPKPSGMMCFGGCTKAVNYGNVPSGWR